LSRHAIDPPESEVVLPSAFVYVSELPLPLTVVALLVGPETTPAPPPTALDPAGAIVAGNAAATVPPAEADGSVPPANGFGVPGLTVMRGTPGSGA